MHVHARRGNPPKRHVDQHQRRVAVRVHRSAHDIEGRGRPVVIAKHEELPLGQPLEPREARYRPHIARGRARGGARRHLGRRRWERGGTRRFLAGLASDLLSADSAAFASGDARRALERAAGASAPRIWSTSLSVLISAWSRSISPWRSSIPCAWLVRCIHCRPAEPSTSVNGRGGDDVWRPRVRRGCTRPVPGSASVAVDPRAWPAWLN